MIVARNDGHRSVGLIHGEHATTFASDSSCAPPAQARGCYRPAGGTDQIVQGSRCSASTLTEGLLNRPGVVNVRDLP
jgi:hypothetical protein